MSFVHLSKVSASSTVSTHFAGVADSWLARYANRPSFRARLQIVGEAVIREAAKRTSLRVLDLGAGAGLFSALVSANAKFVLSLDPSLPMLRGGRSRPDELTRLLSSLNVRPNLTAVHCVAGELDCISTISGADSFDLVMAIAVLEYIEDVEATIRRLAHLVAPTGAVVMTVPDPESVFRRCEGLINRSALMFTRVRPSGRLTGRGYAAVRPHGDRVAWRRTAMETGFLLERDEPLPVGLTGVRRRIAPSRLILLRRPLAARSTIAEQR